MSKSRVNGRTRFAAAVSVLLACACSNPVLGGSLADRVSDLASHAARAVESPVVAVTGTGPARAVTAAADLRHLDASSVVLGRVVGNAAAVVRASSGANQRFELPIIINSPAAAGSKNSRPFVELVQKALRYIPAKRTFEVTALIGLQGEDGTGITTPLPNPIGFVISAPVDSVDPAEIMIDHVNQPYQKVQLSVASPAAQMILDVKSSVGGAPIQIPLAVRRPGLVISAAPQQILGWGLESTTISVQIQEAEGSGLPAIVLTNDKGRLAASSLSLSTAGTAETRMYSTGLSGATITSGSFPVGTLTPAHVDFRFPFAFIVALLLGGATGALIAAKRLSIATLHGVGAGLLVGLLYVLGVNLLNLSIDSPHSSEAAGFVLAAVGGFFGPRILNVLQPK